MITANISKTKNELSRYLDAVRGGETVLILDRNRPIAQIRPLISEEGDGVESRLVELEAKGLLRRAKKSEVDWVENLAAPVGEEPTGSVEGLLEERKSGR